MGFDQRNDGGELRRVLERVLIVGDALFDERAKEAGLHIHVVHVLEVVEGRHWYRIEALRFHSEREREKGLKGFVVKP